MYRAIFRISTKTSLFPVVQIRNRCAQRKKILLIVLKDIFSEFKEGVFDLPPLVGKQSCSVHHFTAVVQQRYLPICLAIIIFVHSA